MLLRNNLQPFNVNVIPFLGALSLVAISSSKIFLSANAAANNIFGPIGTDRPVPAGGDVATDSPLSSFFAGINPPYPTNTWWAGYAAGTGDAVSAGPFPYESNLISSAIQFGISTDRNFDGTSIHQPTQTDWAAGFIEHSGAASDHKATAWDTQSVTVQYFTGPSTMTSYLVPGSPYLTFEFASATPLFTSGQGAITSFNGISLASVATSAATASKFTVTNTAGTYLIYSLSGSLTLTSSTSTITASAPFNGILRVVKLNDPSHEALLDQYYANYPISVETDYSFDSDGETAVLRFTWTVQGDQTNLLMLTWPHHRMKMVSPDFPATTSLNYLTTKGYMYPAIGYIWEMQYDLPSMDWNAPRAPDSSCSSIIIQGLEYEIAQLSASEPSVPGDFYYWGGSMAAQSRLALIADAMGRSDLIPQVIAYMEASFAYWFEAGSAVLPAFETNWGGIVNNQGATNVNVDFGNGYYNDHHFHYGYFLASAAVVAKYDNAWLAQHQTAVNWFLRDIMNPSPADPYFPVTRCRDFFAGHSWASGIANGAGSRDQESSGEAINGYYGAMLWAEVIGDTDMKNYARLLIATEQHAAQTYWHMYPQISDTDRDQPYPESAVRDLITIGNVEDWQSGAWLFWGAEKIEIAAIQILPVTPVNEDLYDTQWVQNIWSYASDEINDPTYADEWKCVIYCAYSNYDPVTAMSLSAELTDWGTGNTFTNQAYFVATRPNPSGQSLCTTGNSNPLGNFTIQSADTNNYVAASSSNTNLVASSSSSSDAAVFAFAFAPNAGTIQLESTSQYVTADSSGDYALAAIRATASTWERFLIRQKTGAATGVYTMKAASNGLWITLGSDGSLINNGASESAAAGFRFDSA